MSDLISREDAKQAIRDRFKDLASRVEINTVLNELPSADAVQGFRGGKIPPKEMLNGTVLIPQHQWLEMERELAESVKVVRCKDCRYYSPIDENKPYLCEVGITLCNKDDFCSYGERREP